MKRAYLIALGGLLFAGAAWAQSAMVQGGSWVAGNVPIYSSVPYSGQPVLVDSGVPPGSPTVVVVDDLPTCSSGTVGLLYVVTDALTPTYGAALTGGSTTVALALCNGNSWRSH